MAAVNVQTSGPTSLHTLSKVVYHWLFATTWPSIMVMLQSFGLHVLVLYKCVHSE